MNHNGKNGAIHFSLDQLRSMIGIHVRYQGQRWQVVEVLEDGPSVVLENRGPCPNVIQPDQYGEGHRRTPENLTVPVLSPDRRELHTRFLALELSDTD
jgi:hypothetical protein